MKCTIEISENSLNCNQVSISRSGHELTNLVDWKTQIKSCEGKIMERAIHNFVLVRIGKYKTFSENKLEVGSTRRTSRLRSMHIMSKKKIMIIFSLTKKQAFGGLGNLKTQKIMK